MKHKKLFIGICVVLTLALAFSGTALAKKRIVFGGGPAGGTFQVVANAIQVYGPVKALENYTIKAQSSAGSVENLPAEDWALIV